jgi:hypothetical protein
LPDPGVIVANAIHSGEKNKSILRPDPITSSQFENHFRKRFRSAARKASPPRTLGENGVIVLTFASEFWTAITMTEQIEKLAQQIASLEESDLQALFERIKELGFRHEINALSERYRKRLKDQVEIDEGAEKILAKLKEIRQEIASREYPG